MVLAAAAAGHADDVEVGPEVGLGPVPAPHERAERAQAGADREDRLRPHRARQDVVDEELERAVELEHARIDAAFAGAAAVLRAAAAADRRGQALEQRPCRMPAVDQDAAVQHQRRVRVPAAGERVVVDGAGADPLGLEAGPGLERELRHVLAGGGGPGGEERPAVLAERALERQADPHPAVVVEVGVGDEPKRVRDRGGRAAQIAWGARDVRAVEPAGSRPGLSSGGTSACACSRKARIMASSTSGRFSAGSSAGDSCGQS